MGLLFYILRQHQSLSRDVSVGSSWHALGRLRVLVRTCFISAALCVGTDVFCVAITAVLRRRATMSVSVAVKIWVGSIFTSASC